LIHNLISDKVYRHALRVVCVIFSVATVCLLSTSTKPSYRFDTVLSSPYREIIPSEYLFPLDTEPVYTTLQHIWYPLDYLTRDDFPGIDCYVASNKSYLALAPIYGSNLQNNPLSIGDDVPPHPEAFVYLHRARKPFSGVSNDLGILYPKTKVTLEEILSNPEYAVITSTKLGCLIMNRTYLRKPGKADKLRLYYAAKWSDAVKDAARLMPHLNTETPLITADEIGYGLFYEELGRGGLEKIIMVPEGYEKHVARTQNISACYTLNDPLRGYTHTKVATVHLSKRQIDVFLNHEI